MKDMNHFFIQKTTAGKIVKSFRTNFNITQQEMSDVIGISSTNLSAIENDRRELGVDLATRIGAFLGINPSLLLFPNGQDDALQKHRGIIKKAEKLKAKKLKKVI
ncbi:MAG: helix-turn-helix transcriptional regulator [Bdellovibrionales bacterium]|nr:helix-turn-helix transcriptional regulator [Bdellovibrionales bacterium]